MRTRFKILFTVQILHGYYGGPSRDFDFVIPSDSQQLLNNGKLLARVRDGVLTVLFEAKESGAPRVSLSGKKLRWGLKLNNPYFSNFTDLTGRPNSSISIYQNQTNAAQFDAPVFVQGVARVFHHSLIEATRPVTVSVTNQSATILSTEVLEAGDVRKSISMNLKQANAGRYTVKESYPAKTENTEYYMDSLLVPDVFGIMEITLADAFYANAAKLTINFTAKPETLRYFVVAQKYSDVEMSQLAIKDASDAITFNSTAVPAGSKHAHLAGPDAKIVMFQSSAAVKRQFKARKGVKLSKNGSDLIEHLPQPFVSKPDSNVIVHISKL